MGFPKKIKKYLPLQPEKVLSARRGIIGLY